MTPPTLFAHLARRFGGQPERLAAEVLAYVLTDSAAMRLATVELCAVAAPELTGLVNDLRFRAEPAAPRADALILIGADARGTTRLAIDARYWGTLPEEQPIRSLQALSTEAESALLVLAPASRFTSLWAELRRRCRQANLPVHGDHGVGDPIRWTGVGGQRTLILASWSVLLPAASARLRAANDRQALAEIDLLAGLSEEQDASAFLPLGPEELAGVSPRRLAQLFRLVDDLAAACEAHGLGRLGDRGGVFGPGFFGRQLRLGMSTFTVCLSVDRWANLRETPFWLLVYDSDGRPARGADARLERLGSEIPPRLLRDGETGCPLVPLFPLPGVEREAVLADLVRQVAEVARLLGEGPTAGFGSRA